MEAEKALMALAADRPGGGHRSSSAGVRAGRQSEFPQHDEMVEQGSSAPVCRHKKRSQPRSAGYGRALIENLGQCFLASGRPCGLYRREGAPPTKGLRCGLFALLVRSRGDDAMAWGSGLHKRNLEAVALLSCGL